MAAPLPSVSNLIFLNQNAVSLATQGKTTAAIRLFQSALNATAENVRQGGGPRDSASTFHVQTIELAPHPLWEDQQSSCSPHNVFQVYNQALLMTESVTDPDEAAMVLLYNFGVTLHMQGVVMGKLRELSFQVAWRVVPRQTTTTTNDNASSGTRTMYSPNEDTTNTEDHDDDPGKEIDVELGVSVVVVV